MAQSSNSISIGAQSGQVGQGYNSIAIGYVSGAQSQGSGAIAIGYNAGYSLQSSVAVAIGYQAGYQVQGTNSIAIGYQAGYTNQQGNSIAIGYSAGNATQSTGSIAIGYFAGASYQGQYSIAIGYQAGQFTQGNGSIAIGYQAGCTKQVANSIIISGGTNGLTGASQGLYINPIRFDNSNTNSLLSYNSLTKEITYSNPVINNLNQSAFYENKKLSTISYTNPVVVKASSISSKINNIIPTTQTFSFGPTINPLWVGVGEGTNTIGISNDGINWFGLGTTIFSSKGNDVRWNGIYWVAVGSGTNSLAYSLNGFNWNGLNIFSTSGYSVAWSDISSLWVVGGADATHTMYISPDSINWTGLGSSVFSTQCNGINFNGNIFCAVGSGTNTIAYSSNGFIWTGIGSTIFSTSGNYLSWNGSIFAAVGSGTNTVAYSTSNILNPTTNSPIYIIGTGSGVYYSYDYINWIQSNLTYACASVCYDGSGYYLAGIKNGSSSTNLYYSTNGISWTATSCTIFNIATYAECKFVTYQNGYYIAGGFGSTYPFAYASTPTGTWTGILSTLFGNSGGYDGTCAIYAFGYYIFGGNNATASTTSGAISYATSITGSYTYASLNMTGKCFSFCSNGSVLVAVGLGATYNIYTSTNGTTWSNPYLYGGSGTGVLYSCAYGNNIFAVDGYNAFPTTTNSAGYSTTPPSSSSWVTSANIFPGGGGRGIFFINNQFFAVGNSNIIYTSVDAINWAPVSSVGSVTLISSMASNYNQLISSNITSASTQANWIGLGTTIFATSGNDIQWNGIYWIAVGTDSTNTVYYSSNALTWTSLGKTIFATSGSCLSWNGNYWIAGGVDSSNTISTSQDSLTWNGLGSSVFSTGCYGIEWNSRRRNTISFPNNVIVAGGIGTYTLAYSYNGFTWFPVTNNLFNNGVNGLYYNGNIWLALGSGAVSIAYSTNGSSWTGITNSTTIFSTSGNMATWFINLFIAVGTGSAHTIAYSTDGISWIGLGSTIFSTAGYGIAYSGNYIVAVGAGTNCIAYATSLNSTSWTGLGVTLSASLNAVIYDNKKFIAIGLATILYSYNAVVWTSTTSVFTTGYGIAYNGFRYVAVGTGTNSIGYSSDGITWTGSGSSILTTAYGVTWTNSIWIAVGSSASNSIAYSIDGITWTGITGTTIFSTRGSYISTNNLKQAKVSIKHSSIAYGTGNNTLAYSLNGITWSGLGSTMFSTQGNGGVWNGSKVVAVGSGTNSIAYSICCINWIGLGTTIFTGSGNGITYNNNYFVAVGNGTNSIAYSVDGISWFGLGTTVFTTKGSAICSNGSLWVAVGSGTNTIAYSSNLTSWTGLALTVFSTSGNGIAFNGVQFVAVGSGTNTLAYSANGSTWTVLSTFSSAGYGIAWSGSLWVAGGNGIYYSFNGSIWTKAPTNLTTCYTVAWNQSVFIAGGTGTDMIEYSYNGFNWLSGDNSIFTTVYGISTNDVGPFLQDSQFVLDINGVEQTNQLDVSSNFYSADFSTMNFTIRTDTLQ